jgi:hypothetical protein
LTINQLKVDKYLRFNSKDLGGSKIARTSQKQVYKVVTAPAPQEIQIQVEFIPSTFFLLVQPSAEEDIAYLKELQDMQELKTLQVRISYPNFDL